MGKHNLARRQVLKILGASATIPLVACNDEGEPIPYEPLAAGTPSDPDLIAGTVDWKLVLTPEEMTTVTALCDVIIPEDDVSGAASSVGVPDFINEWVSAPYPSQQSDQVVIRGGLVWINTEATERFESQFAELEIKHQHAICNDIQYTRTATDEFQPGARFFRLFRNLTASGFYTTRVGMNDLGYVGNQALPRFDGPPPEVLRHLSLDT
jgi:hypothetical protein